MLTAEHFLRSGKVRDLWELPDGRLVLIASDRISAFDVVLPTEIPDKGRVLTGLSRFWFTETGGIVRNHVLDTDPAVVQDAVEIALEGRPTDARAAPDIGGAFDEWRGRVMICQQTEVVPIEAVVRGYLAGSGWKEYQATGSICGNPIPPGLRESDRLPEPIFTPATKAEQGEHDQNIDFDAMIEHIGRHWMFTPSMATRRPSPHAAGSCWPTRSSSSGSPSARTPMRTLSARRRNGSNDASGDRSAAARRT